MIRLTGGVGDGDENVVALEKGVITKNFVVRGTGGEQIEQVADAHALATDAWLAAALVGVDCDPGEQVRLDSRQPDSRYAIGKHRGADLRSTGLG